MNTLSVQASWPFLHGSHNRDKIACDLTEVLKMANQLEALEAEALKLTSGERAAFAQLLLASLDEDAEIEEAWAAEVERRIADVESGAVQVIPISEALAQVRAALK
jgi:putative addiction module component (TIGR02574 family)